MTAVSPRLEVLRKVLAAFAPPHRIRLLSEDLLAGPAAYASTAAFHFHIRTGPDLPSRGQTLDRLATLPDGLGLDPLAPGDGSRPADAEWFGGVIAQVAAEQLGRKLFLNLAHGSRGESERDARCWVEHVLPQFAVPALRLALSAVGWAAVGRGSPAMVRAQLSILDQALNQFRPSLQSIVLMREARANDIPFLQIGNGRALWQFGWGERSAQFWTTSSTGDGIVGHHISVNKERTKRHLRQIGLPTPRSYVLGPDEDPHEAGEDIGWPRVAKPIVGGGGHGVTAGIPGPAGLAEAVELARRHSSSVLIEAHQEGHDHRLMVIDGDMVAAVRRQAPTVIGDGRRSVAELIEELNESRREPVGVHPYLLAVPIDSVVTTTLAEQDLTLASVPSRGQRVLLRTNANFSTGGSAVDVMDDVHPDVRAAAELIAATTRLRIVGIDYITPDIGLSWSETGGAFIEINTTAAIDVLFSAGIGAERLGQILLGTRLGRIPALLVICNSNEQEPIRLALEEGLRPGAASAGADWSAIGTTAMPAAAMSPVERVTALLRYPAVKTLTILWNFDLIRRHGLPLDRFDTIVVVGGPLAHPWDLTLERHSGRVLNVGNAADAIAAVIGQSQP